MLMLSVAGRLLGQDNETLWVGKTAFGSGADADDAFADGQETYHLGRLGTRLADVDHNTVVGSGESTDGT